MYTHIILRVLSLYPNSCGTHASRESLLRGDSVGVVLQNTVQMIVVSLEPSLLLRRRLLPLLDWRLQQFRTRFVCLRTYVCLYGHESHAVMDIIRKNWLE